MSTQNYQTGYWDHMICDFDTAGSLKEEQTMLQRMGKDGWEHYFAERLSQHFRRHYFKRYIKTPPQKLLKEVKPKVAGKA